MTTERELQTALDFLYSAALSNPTNGPILGREMAKLLLDLLPSQVPTLTIKPDAQKEAMDWLDRCTVDPDGEQTRHVGTIKKMLAKAVQEKTPELKVAYWIDGYSSNGGNVYSKSAYCNAERDSFYRSAWGTAGCVRVTIAMTAA